MDTGLMGHDNSTALWRRDKTLPFGGQLFHTGAGIPDVTEVDIPTQADVIKHVIETRHRELFVEGRHRQRDHLRWRGTPSEIPYLGEPGSDHPDGIDQSGQPYGNTTCFPAA